MAVESKSDSFYVNLSSVNVQSGRGNPSAQKVAQVAKTAGGLIAELQSAINNSSPESLANILNEHDFKPLDPVDKTNVFMTALLYAEKMKKNGHVEALLNMLAQTENYDLIIPIFNKFLDDNASLELFKSFFDKHASQHKNALIVKLSTRDSQGRTPIEFAHYNGNIKSFEKLLHCWTLTGQESIPGLGLERADSKRDGRMGAELATSNTAPNVAGQTNSKANITFSLMKQMVEQTDLANFKKLLVKMKENGESISVDMLEYLVEKYVVSTVRTSKRDFLREAIPYLDKDVLGRRFNGPDKKDIGNLVHIFAFWDDGVGIKKLFENGKMDKETLNILLEETIGNNQPLMSAADFNNDVFLRSFAKGLESRTLTVKIALIDAALKVSENITLRVFRTGGKNELEKLQMLMKYSSKAVAELQGRVVQLDNQVNGLASQVQSLTNDKQTLTTQKDNLTVEKETLGKEKSSLEHEIDRLTRIKDTTESSLAELRQQNSILQNRVQELNTTIENLNTTIADLRTEQRKSTERDNIHAKELTDIREKHDNATKQLKELQLQLKSQGEAHAQKMADVKEDHKKTMNALAVDMGLKLQSRDEANAQKISQLKSSNEQAIADLRAENEKIVKKAVAEAVTAVRSEYAEDIAFLKKQVELFRSNNRSAPSQTNNALGQVQNQNNVVQNSQVQSEDAFEEVSQEEAAEAAASSLSKLKSLK